MDSLARSLAEPIDYKLRLPNQGVTRYDYRLRLPASRGKLPDSLPTTTNYGCDRDDSLRHRLQITAVRREGAKRSTTDYGCERGEAKRSTTDCGCEGDLPTNRLQIAATSEEAESIDYRFRLCHGLTYVLFDYKLRLLTIDYSSDS